MFSFSFFALRRHLRAAPPGAAKRLLAALAVLAGLAASGAPDGVAQGLLRQVAPASQLGVPAAATSVPAAPGAQRVGAIEVELVADRAAVAPGGTVRLGLRLKHDADWHTYWRNPGDSGLPTQLRLALPSGWSAGEIEWPAPQRFAIGPLANYGYAGEIVLPVTVQVPADAAGSQARVTATAQWLVCREVCVPGDAALALDVPLLPAGQATASRWMPLFEAMAARTPRGVPLGARMHRDAQGVSLVFASTAASAEFFPYAEGLVKPAAPQALYAIDAQQRRLALQKPDEPQLAAPASRDAAGAGPAEEAVDGLLMLDGRPVELRAQPDTAAAPVGQRIAVAMAQPGAPAPAAAAGTSGGALAVAIASGLLGGLLLNLMPCVFPVIGLKLIGFAQDGAGSPARMRQHAWAFAAGILTAFAALAAGLLGLRAAGETVGWGFQLQSPGFVAAMSLLFVAIGLNFSGVFEVGTALTRLGARPGLPAGDGGHARGRHLSGAFGSGLLATLVATPCTAPFMGSAIGFTLGQPATVLLAVLSAVAVGMAAPYVLLAHVPSLARRLPRPGRWMESFKQFLAFPMYATAAWLTWVLGLQAGMDAVLRLVLAAVLLGLAAWAWGRFWQHGSGRPAAVAAVLAVATGAAAVWLAWPGSAAAPDGLQPVGITSEQGLPEWEPYSEVRLQTLRAQGRTVFVDFTAAWCISCQANKKLVLDADAVRAAFARRDVVLLRADWTRRDPEITRALAEFGRNGVPLYLVYRPDAARAAVLPELLSATAVLRAVEG